MDSVLSTFQTYSAVFMSEVIPWPVFLSCDSFHLSFVLRSTLPRLPSIPSSTALSLLPLPGVAELEWLAESLLT